MTPESRFRPLVVLLLGVWLVAFGLTLDDVLRRTAYPPVAIEPAQSPESYPRVVGLKLGQGAREQGLRVGDRILRVGAVDLRGGGHLAWAAAISRHRGRAIDIPIAVERAGERLELTLQPGSRARYWPRIVASLAYVACTFFLLLRMRPTKLVRALVYTNLTAANVLVCTFEGAPWETALSVAIHAWGGMTVAPLALRAYLLFPDGVGPRTPWARFGPWVFASIGVFDLSTFFGTPLPRAVGAAGTGIMALVFVAVFVFVLGRCYRSADPIGRRKLKWVVLGHYLAAIPLAIAYGFAGGSPDAAPLAVVAVSAIGIIPLFMLIAITGYNFLDVDRLLSSTTSLSIVLFACAGVLLVAMPALAGALSEALGLHPTVSQLFVLAGLAAAAVGVHGRLLGRVERFLFAERLHTEEGMAGLIQELSRCRTPDDVTRSVADGLDRLLAPSSIVIYARLEDLFAPSLVRGELAPPRFSLQSPLVSALEGQPGLLVRDDRSVGRIGGGSLTPFQTAVLDTLDVPVVAPIRRENVLVGFVCLGAKRSGDVYSSTDVALLALLVDKISSELLRFDQSQLVETSRALQVRLARYIPSPLVERLEGKQELDLGEVEVSVLFVDIRGYSRMVEHLDPREVFSTVNRYTELVSSVIRSSGGIVVEFNGDGMMAVFGAPGPLAHKEQAAVEAGTQIVERVGSLAGAGGSFQVGIGVATGLAYVGSIQAVDRMIWTALGNTTNLASRLQSMTRELDAAMIIDESTWQEAGGIGHRFRPHRDTSVRGVSGRHSLYVLAQSA